MKKLIYSLLLLFCPLFCFAQDDSKGVEFLIQVDASFKTAEGKDFVVVDYPGKTAKELYDLFLAKATTSSYTMQKATKHFKSPHTEIVGNRVEGSSFTIYGCVSKMAETAGSMSIHIYGKYWACNYSFSVMFKDGKVRINAPVMQNLFFEKEKVNLTGDKHEDFWLDDYKRFCTQFCDFKRNGTPNPKNECYISTNKRMNEEINRLFTEGTNEDW